MNALFFIKGGNQMKNVIDWANMVIETKGGFISLWDIEYLSVARSIIRIMKEAIYHDMDFSLDMSTNRLVKNLNIGLNRYRSEKIYTSIIFIDAVDSSGFFQIGLYDTNYIDYIVLEQEIRNLIRRCHRKYSGS